jgi:methylated-DNA-protein-cysteine methyltransferase-like protein
VVVGAHSGERERTRRSAGVTSTQSEARLRAIWAAVAALPHGTVATYGRVAALAGCPRAPRLVGRALREAPTALRLPWHRVVAAGGRIAFPAGSRPFREQCRRLRAEGLQVEKGRVRIPAARDLDALLWGDGR